MMYGNSEDEELKRLRSLMPPRQQEWLEGTFDRVQFNTADGHRIVLGMDVYFFNYFQRRAQAGRIINSPGGDFLFSMLEEDGAICAYVNCETFSVWKNVHDLWADPDKLAAAKGLA